MKYKFKKNSMTWFHLGVGLILLAVAFFLAIRFLEAPQKWVVCAVAAVALVIEEIVRYKKTGIFKDIVVTEEYIEERGLFRSRRILFSEVGTRGEISTVYTNSSRGKYFVTTDVYKKKVESEKDLDKNTTIVFDMSAKSIKAYVEIIFPKTTPKPELED